MPENKRKDPLHYALEEARRLGSYHDKLITYAKQKLKARKKKSQELKQEGRPGFVLTNENEFFWAAYNFKRAIDSLRDKPNCHFQETYYLISNMSVDSKEARELITHDIYEKRRKKLENRGITVEEEFRRQGKTIERIGLICSPQKIHRRAIHPEAQKEVYCEFHCPFRGFKSYEDEETYFLKCNRPEIADLMKQYKVSDIEELVKKIKYDSKVETLVSRVCSNQSAFGALRHMYEEGMSRQEIEDIIDIARVVIEKTKSQ